MAHPLSRRKMGSGTPPRISDLQRRERRNSIWLFVEYFSVLILKDILIIEYIFLQYWDPEIAEIAQYFAETCPDEHDENRNVPGIYIIEVFLFVTRYSSN